MDDQFYQDDFERYLQQQVKQHRMYPSDAVWNGIYKELHGYKRWPGLYFIAVMMIAALTVTTALIQSEPIAENAPIATIKTAQIDVRDHFNPIQVTANTIKKIGSNTGYHNKANFTIIATGGSDYIEAEYRGVDGLLMEGSNYNQTSSLLIPTPIIPNDDVMVGALNSASLQAVVADASIDDVDRQDELVKDVAMTSITEELAANNDEPQQTLPKVKKHASKWQLQFYITPSMSYRSLVDKMNPSSNSNGATIAKLKYKPGMGTEIGAGVLYSINERFRIKTGVQLNIRQYNIEAFAGNTELAKIALIWGGYTDTLNTLAKYRSSENNTYGQAELINKYYQFTMPIGVEYNIINGRLGLGIGATIQPTYTFSQSSYLATTDYNSYADGTSLLRKWNINSSVEAIISYNIGDFQWKFGPQVRYQHLPTYSDPYPIKEYLIDYGFKLGFTKTIR